MSCDAPPPAPSPWSRDLLRIESTAVAALFFFTFVVGPYKRWQTNPTVRFLNNAATAGATTLFSQVLGTLNSNHRAEDQLYLVWAVFLSVALDTTLAATAYSIYESSAVRVAFEIGVLTNSVNVAVLMGLASFDKFLGPLWALWGFTIAKMLQRVLSFRAAAQTYGPDNVDLIAHFMSEPERREGDKVNYRVRGEDKVSYTYDGSSSKLVVSEDDKNRIVTIDQVWSCEGRLLKDDEQEKRRIATRLKDVCLSFALFKLLRRRFRDYPAEDEEQRRTAKSLVLEKLLLKKDTGEETTPEIKEDDLKRQCTRTFRVIQVELEFLHDLFNTKYPISFYRGVSFLNILQMLVIASSVWTATWVLKEFYHKMGSNGDAEWKSHTDLVLTYIFTVVVIVMELWELSNHLLSNWCKVLTTCNYVRHHDCRDKFHIDKLVAIQGCCGTLWKPLNEMMGQYSLFRGYKSHSIYSKLYKVATSFTGETEGGTGAKQSPPAKVTGDVQYAIFRALRKKHCDISNGKSSLERNIEKLEPNTSKSTAASAISEACSLKEKIFKACNEEKLERKIMVWHIATSYFELETTTNINRKKMKKVGKGDSEVAIRLSRYCAYLLLFAPDLLPVNSLVAKLMFEEVISRAQNFFDNDVSWWEKLFYSWVNLWCGKLMPREAKKMYKKMEKDVTEEDAEESMGSIMAEGINLAKALKSITEMEVNKEANEKQESIKEKELEAQEKVDEESIKELEPEEKRWKVLAEFWAEFLLFLAPSDNAEAHREKLAKGGEFITHLWVLLYNAGIIDRQEGTV